MDSPVPPGAQSESPPPPYPWLKPVGFVVGVALLTAAVWSAWGQREALAEALRHSVRTRWWLVGLALALPVLNWLTTCGIFYVLTRAHSARVRPGEMCALVGASWLFNYLPASPGLFGRVVYHRRVHGIPWAASAGIVVTAMVTSVGVVGVTALVGVMCRFNGPWFVGAPAALGVVAAAMALVLRREEGRWRFAAALALRCVDLYVWSARYFVVMHVLGLGPTASSALVLGVVSQTAVLIPFLGNGLGLREWAVGLVGPALPTWFHGAAGMARGVGLSVDLVNRACEVVVAVPVGLLSAAVLARGLRGPARGRAP